MLEFCLLKSGVYSNTPAASPEHVDSCCVIFAICAEIQIAPLFPTTFYRCLCKAYDNIITEDISDTIMTECDSLE